MRMLAELRPRLHRYCARMTGSAVDGEDVVQEVMLKVLELLRYRLRQDEANPRVGDQLNAGEKLLRYVSGNGNTKFALDSLAIELST